MGRCDAGGSKRAGGATGPGTALVGPSGGRGGQCIDDNGGAVREFTRGSDVASGQMRVQVDLTACTGHGRCYSLSPDVFSADDEGHCLLAFEDVPPGLEDQARRGAANCPEQAITVEE